jgi:hypothetical protein
MALDSWNFGSPDLPKPKLSSGFFSNIGGAVSDIFGGQATALSAQMRGTGLNIQAAGIRIKAQGDLAEASNYDLASALARQNEAYTVQSQAIQQMQLDRQIAQTIGSQQAEVAGSGLAASGSALDLLRDSAAQGSLAKSVLAQQGIITEAGYEEQAKSYDTMSSATKTAASGEMGIAAQTDQLAAQTVAAGKQAETGSFITAALKGVAAVATLF